MWQITDEIRPLEAFCKKSIAELEKRVSDLENRVNPKESVSKPEGQPKEIDFSSLNPGIVKTVKWLLSLGFHTVDSGVGVTHEYECDLDYPYVHMRVDDPTKLVSETQRLHSELQKLGINIEHMNEDTSSPCIEAYYFPVNSFAGISLFNVKL